MSFIKVITQSQWQCDACGEMGITMTNDLCTPSLPAGWHRWTLESARNPDGIIERVSHEYCNSCWRAKEVKP